eukprot:gene12873-17251_t
MNSQAADLDLNPLLRLKEALEGAQKNTSKMLTKLERFDNRLEDLDLKMRPIHQSTLLYTTAKKNIAQTLAEIEKNHEYFRVTSDVKDIISTGFSVSNEDKDIQKDYLAAITRLSEAKKFFMDHHEIKSSASLLVSIEQMLKQGIMACGTEFEKLIVLCGKTIEYVDGRYNVANIIPVNVGRDIKAICDTLDLNKETSYFKIYQSVRISRLKADLKDLENQYASAWMALLQEGPYEKGSHPFQNYYKLVYVLLRNELQMWGSTLPSNEESLSVFINICAAGISEINRVLAPIVHEDKSNRQGNQTIKQCKTFLIRLDVLEIFLSQLEEFRDLCRPDVRRENVASESVLKVKDLIIQACVTSIDHLLGLPFTNGFIPVVRKILSTTTSSSDVLINDELSCDLHPITGNIVHCCREVVTLASVYRKMYDYLNQSNMKLIKDMTVTVVVPPDHDSFINAILEQLYSSIEERALRFNDTNKIKTRRRSLDLNAHAQYDVVEDRNAEGFVLAARQHLFWANNLFCIFNYVKDKKNEISDPRQTSNSSNIRRGSTGPISLSNKMQQFQSFSDKIELRLAKEKSNFCESIAIAMTLSKEDMTEFKDAHEKDKSGKGRVLKAKFSAFNSGMEAFLSQQGEWRISATGLREQISNELVNRIKHMNEYIKYTPQDVERNLVSFFGRS